MTAPPLDNPFRPVWDETRQHFVVEPNPADWVREHHPEAMRHAAILDGQAGLGWSWDDGTLFAGGAKVGLNSHGVAVWTQLAQHRFVLDELGDWVVADQPVPVAITGTTGGDTELSTHHRDGSVVVERLGLASVVREVMDAEGVRSFGMRLLWRGIELSETCLSADREPLARRADASQPWQWLVPDFEVDEARQMVFEAFGVRL